MFRATLYALVLVALGSPTLADEVTDTLDSAMKAYGDGDIAYAIDELNYAKQLLQKMNMQELTVFLPDAPAGWTREISEDGGANVAMGFMGGGAAAEATYSNESDSFTITIMADNPMIAMTAGMISNAAMLGMKLYRVGRQKFVLNDGNLSGLVDNRILVQAEGADPEVMKPVLEAIDYKALAAFGK